MRIPLAAAVMLLALPAQAQQVPEHAMRYSRDRGGDCSAMIPYYGPAALWIGRIAAQRPMDVSSDRIFADRRVAESCFFTEIECRTWLARLQIDWAPRPGFAECQPGNAGVLRRGGRAPGSGPVIKP